MSSKNYLNNADLMTEIILSKEIDYLTPTAEKMLILLANKIIKKFRYYNPIDRDDCLQTALYVVFSNWRNFDEVKSTNAFSYFSEVIKRGTAKGFNELYKFKGDPDRKIKTVSIQSSNDGEGIYNL
jgi:hypothetical protein